MRLLILPRSSPAEPAARPSRVHLQRGFWSASLPPSSPFSADFLSREWPLLLEACSLPRDPCKISAAAASVKNFESLLALADEHGVIPHLTAALGAVPDLPFPSSFFATLRERKRAHLLFSLTMTAELFRILGLLGQAGIDAMVVKGPVLSQRAYGDPAARRYVDLDLLLRHSDIQRATEILIAAQYESRVPAAAIREGKIPGEYLFRRPGTGVVFELHTERTFRYYPRRIPVENYFQHKTTLTLDGHAVPVLCAEDEFVLIAIHGAKHFWERLMWISDIAAMVHHHPELDWDKIRRGANDVGAERMIRVALLLAQHFLGVPVPQAMNTEVAGDSSCPRLLRDIESWLPYGGFAAPALSQRALFRSRIPGRFAVGAAYLMRLSFSPTEEDWSVDAQEPRSRVVEMLGRPFRLAKKYRDPDS